MDKLPNIWMTFLATTAIEALTVLAAFAGILADIFGFSEAAATSCAFALTSLKVTGALMIVLALHSLTVATLEMRASPRTPLP